MVEVYKNGTDLSNINDNAVTVFLGGGFTSNWRDTVIEELRNLSTEDEKLIIFDPSYDGDDVCSRTRWEHRAIDLCDVFGCYLEAGGVHPMSLYELGYASCLMDTIVVGQTKGYEKGLEVEAELRAVSGDFVFNSNILLINDADPKEFAIGLHNRVVLNELDKDRDEDVDDDTTD